MDKRIKEVILAIDPGNDYSAFVVWDGEEERILEKNKILNTDLEDYLDTLLIREYQGVKKVGICAIEMVASYGFSIGQTTIDTVFWIGRFSKALQKYRVPIYLPFRTTIKLHHCHALRKVNDSAITAELVNKYGEDNTKKKPNSLYYNEVQEKYGSYPYMNGDLWSAFAIATWISEGQEYGLSKREREDNKLSITVQACINNTETTLEGKVKLMEQSLILVD